MMIREVPIEHVCKLEHLLNQNLRRGHRLTTCLQVSDRSLLRSMATRRILSLFRGIRTSAQFAATTSNRPIPSSCISKRTSHFTNNTTPNHRHFILTILFSGQAAVFLMDENRFAYAQEDSSSELLSENAQGREQNQEGYVSDLQRVEDGTVVSNEHTIKWRLFTDNGRNLFSKGKLDEAEKAFELALKEAKLGFGQRDPHVASSCNNLAELKRVRKKFEEAEPLYSEAISILEESFGPDDVRVGAALHNLGQFYLAQHKLDKARKCYERALKIKGRILGHNNPDYASTVHHLGRVLYLQGKEKDAEALIKESISILEENGLGESLACIRRMTTLSQIMLKSNRPADAEMLQRKILHALELSKGYSLETARAAEALALTLQSLGNLKESQELLEKCLEVRKKILSEDHIQVASTMLHLARLAIYDSKPVPLANGKYSDNTDSLIRAKELLDNSIRITKATLRREKKKTDDIHGAILLYLQALDDVGLLESKKHEMLSLEGTAGYPYEAEHALRECISIYNEPQIRSILLNAPDAKAQYLTCLNRLSIMIGESADEKTRTKELKDLIGTAKHIKDELLPKKNTKKSV